MPRPDTSTHRPAGLTRRRPWLDHLLLLGALAVLLLGYSTVLEGRDWWVTTTLVAGLLSLVCAVLGAVAPRWAVPVGALVLLLVLGWVFAPSTFAGVLPTPATLGSLGASLDRAQVLVMEEAAPAAAARPLVLLLAGAFGLLVLVLELVLRLRVGVQLTGVALLSVYAAPALVSGQTPPVWLFLGAAACWLALLRTRTVGTGTGWTSLLPALGVGGSALLVGALLPPVLPDVTAVAKPWGDPPPQVFGRGINPMLQLGQNLRRNSTAVAARYTTTLDDVPYLKVATLRDFEGRTWRPVRGRADDVDETAATAPDVERSTETTRIRIADLRSSLLPVPYVALDVRGLDGRWTLQPTGQTVSSRTSTTQGQTYTVTSLDRRPTAEQMRALRTVPTDVPLDYTALPSGVPAVVGETARRVTADATNDYDRALALQDYFRDEFTYSETAPVAEDYDGNGVGVLGTFLREKSGYCVHFSSAMAVMARQLDMPSRIAVGYAPGRAVGADDGSTEYAVTSDDLHAWPEIYFDGVGWVGFEPTPGVGDVTAFDEPDDGSTQTGPNTPQEQPSAPPSDATQREGGLVADDVAADDTAEPTAPRTVLTVALLVLAAMVLPGIVRALTRRRRLTSGEPDAWWRELEATAVDVGLDVPRAGTPRSFADTLAGRTDVEDLRRLVTSVERARYARPGADVADERPAARRLIGQVDASGTWHRRVRARLLPRSLWRRG